MGQCSGSLAGNFASAGPGLGFCQKMEEGDTMLAPRALAFSGQGRNRTICVGNDQS